MGCAVLDSCIQTCNSFNYCDYHQVKEKVVYPFLAISYVIMRQNNTCSISYGRLIVSTLLATRNDLD